MDSLKKGVCAARGFKAGAIQAKIKASSTKDDVALIVSDVPCAAAAVYTSNLVKADCLHITKEHLENGIAQAIIVNSGNANAAAPDGKATALAQAKAGARAAGVALEDVIVSSTGVIGQRLPVEKIEAVIDQIQISEQGSDAAAKAIMTTDTVMKEASVSFEINGTTCYLGGICKGSGMIHPNMGTMLCFITTDAKIAQPLLQEALSKAVKVTFNRISVDGDTSTNDMCVVLANGLADNTPIEAKNEAWQTFYDALYEVMRSLAIQIASDGEGAGRLVSAKVIHAQSEQQAENLAKSVITSNLVKAAMFGCDANVGRILCAMGYSGQPFELDKVDVSYISKNGEILVCENGKGLAFDEDLAEYVLQPDAIDILIDLHDGTEEATCWGCDLTYEYVKINGDYRT
jgi:glutamate N-acetyltransferase/amino-acid N-acetyltransferase